jgi:hypothetical protein
MASHLKFKRSSCLRQHIDIAPDFEREGKIGIAHVPMHHLFSYLYINNTRCRQRRQRSSTSLTMIWTTSMSPYRYPTTSKKSMLCPSLARQKGEKSRPRKQDRQTISTNDSLSMPSLRNWTWRYVDNDRTRADLLDQECRRPDCELAISPYLTEGGPQDSRI